MFNLLTYQSISLRYISSFLNRRETFEFPFTTELETLVAKDNNGLYYARLVAASMAAVSV